MKSIPSWWASEGSLKGRPGSFHNTDPAPPTSPSSTSTPHHQYSGFQIWCQLLTYISRASEVGLLVLDEPEIYLHPDIQRQLAGLLMGLGPQIIVATHSQELIRSVDPRDVLIIDKTKAL